jgi:hypothetical protein
LGKEDNDFSSEIFEVGDRLTGIMDRMREKLGQKGNYRMKKCFRALVKAQGELLKAFSSFDDTYKIAPEAGETWEHFLAKNFLIKEIPREHIFPEFGFRGCVFDVVAKIGGEYVIIEAETVPAKCVEKARKIKAVIASLMSEMPETSDADSVRLLSQIRGQLKNGKPIRLIFVVSARPYTSTLKDIKNEGNTLVHPEVYHIKRIPPFGKSSNLLEHI